MPRSVISCSASKYALPFTICRSVTQLMQYEHNVYVFRTNNTTRYDLLSSKLSCTNNALKNKKEKQKKVFKNNPNKSDGGPIASGFYSPQSQEEHSRW